MITRVIAIVAAALLVAAAPARAWCEASCVAPAAHGDAAKPHCPSHDPAGSGTSIAATAVDDCPVIEAARPTTTARVDAHVMGVAAITLHRDAPATSASSVIRPHGVTTVFERSTPLRI